MINSANKRNYLAGLSARAAYGRPDAADPWDNLANAVVAQACDDLRRVLKGRRPAGEFSSKTPLKAYHDDIKRWLTGSAAELFLHGLDGQMIYDRIVREVEMDKRKEEKLKRYEATGFTPKQVIKLYADLRAMGTCETCVHNIGREEECSAECYHCDEPCPCRNCDCGEKWDWRHA